MFGKLFRRKPEATFDGLFGDPEGPRLRKAIKNGDWVGLQQFFEQKTDHHNRSFYLQGLYDVPGRPKWLDHWVREREQSQIAWLFRGAHSLHWAWQAPESIPDKAEAIKAFKERLEAARQELDYAARLAPEDPTPYIFLLMVHRAASRDLKEAEQLLAQAMERSPGHRFALSQYLAHLSTQSGGRPESTLDFALYHADKAPPGSHLHSLVPEAHIQVWNMQEEGDDYFRRPKIIGRIESAYEQSCAHYTFKDDLWTPFERNNFAFCFWMAGRIPACKQELEKLGNFPSRYPWGHVGPVLPTFALARKHCGLK